MSNGNRNSKTYNLMYYNAENTGCHGAQEFIGSDLLALYNMDD